MTFPKKMIPANGLSGHLIRHCGGELTWSHFKRLIYRAVQHIQIITITASTNERTPGIGNYIPLPERWASAHCLPSVLRFGVSFISFQPLCHRVHAAVRVLASRRRGFLPSCFPMQSKPKLEIIDALLTQRERFANYPMHRIGHNPCPLKPTLLILFYAET